MSLSGTLNYTDDKIILNKEYQIQDIGAAKSFTEVMQAEQHLVKN